MPADAPANLALQKLMADGLNRHRRGDITGASEAYRAVLGLDPNQPDALNLLGVVMHQTGNLPMAESLIRAAIAAAPDFAPAHVNLGNTLQARGNAAAAAEAFRQAIALSPDLAEARSNLASALVDLGQIDDAIAEAGIAVKQRPNDASTLNTLANIYQAAGDLDNAAKAYTRAVQAAPNHPEVHANFGAVLMAQQRFDEARIHLEKAHTLGLNSAGLGLNLGMAYLETSAADAAHAILLEASSLYPKTGPIKTALGVALTALDRPSEAAVAFRAALAIDPEDRDCRMKLIAALRMIGDLAAAEAEARKALAETSDKKGLQALLGNLLLEAGKAIEAEAVLREAHSNDPSDVETCISLAVCLNRSDQPDLALGVLDANIDSVMASTHGAAVMGALLDRIGHIDRADHILSQAIVRAPSDVDLRINRAVVRKAQGDLAGAANDLSIAKAQAPDNIDAHWNHALVQLCQDNYAQGWQSYQWRWRMAHRPRPHTGKPDWQGEKLDGPLLITAEQGIGDTVQFCRLLEMAQQRTEMIILQVQPGLEDLLKESLGNRLNWIIDVVSGADVPSHAATLPLLDLPVVLGLAPDHRTTFTLPYLFATEPKTILGEKRVGFVWSGNQQRFDNRLRGITAQDLMTMTAGLGLTRASLQFDGQTDLSDAGAVAEDVIDLMADVTTWQQTANAIAGLDLVVTVDTAVAHLAGAMGKPVWVMFWAGRDFRYPGTGPENEWYPSMRVFRQEKRGIWTPALLDLQAALADWATS